MWQVNRFVRGLTASIAGVAMCIACGEGEDRSSPATPAGSMMDAAAPSLHLDGLSLPVPLELLASARPSAKRESGGLADSIPGGVLYFSAERLNSEPAPGNSPVRAVEAHWTLPDDSSARVLFDSLRGRWDAYFGAAAVCRRSADAAPPSILAGWDAQAGVAYLDLRLAHEIPVDRVTAPVEPVVVLGVQVDSQWLSPLVASRARVECSAHPDPPSH